ncbi:MAG: Asp23/Gls24 family envelope stress response protein [Synergistaceae bacterium]|nr:Asp23/Gls24 family envelope stress response protein [Synergistaceae bacterium]
MPDLDEKQDASNNGGEIHISEEVIAEIVRKTIQGIENLKVPEKLTSKFTRSKKSSGVRVNVDNSQRVISVDAYILVKYGQRIPDLAWDVQEKLKDNLEKYTGYEVKAVNINVAGIYTEDNSLQLNIDTGTENNLPEDEAD